MSLSFIVDAAQAISRLSNVFEAELLQDTCVIDTSLEVALRVENASFTWDAPSPDDEKVGSKDKSRDQQDKRKGCKGKKRRLRVKRPRR